MHLLYSGGRITVGRHAWLPSLAKGNKKKFIAPFGASDLELNISSENDFYTIGLRRFDQGWCAVAGASHKDLRCAAYDIPVSPIWFSDRNHLGNGELIITICKARLYFAQSTLSVNLHDRPGMWWSKSRMSTHILDEEAQDRSQQARQTQNGFCPCSFIMEGLVCCCIVDCFCFSPSTCSNRAAVREEGLSTRWRISPSMLMK